MNRTFLRRTVLMLAIVGSTMSATNVASAQADAVDLCYITVHDHTPGVYPGGMHVHTNCV